MFVTVRAWEWEGKPTAMSVGRVPGTQHVPVDRVSAVALRQTSCPPMGGGSGVRGLRA